MKKVVFLAAFAVFGLSAVQAQEVRLGAKAGVNFASIGGDDTEEIDGRTSFHIGLLAEIPLGDRFTVQPEILYSAQGAKVEYTQSPFDAPISYKEKLKLDYINIPIMAKYYVIEGLSLEAGPQFGILVSAKAETEATIFGETESSDFDVKDSFKTLDIGLGLGAGYRLNNGIFFSARYVLGLSNMVDMGDEFELYDEGDFKQHNNVIQLSVGYSF